ncbi:AzlC family ABC transporter permease [Alkalihalobacillus macyae]|uniref:AzlC family ABC transporter permease n=1 Tax=Guptibacillus hwajinpoensis TaxID=208199 RepID=UPI00273AE76E|nr:AzlC family ABC transporter permease [Alkalihalobacillus macyae]MDP4551794.1 AzlC family ABC transporter permease [Alkalihalobacillus macyae]
MQAISVTKSESGFTDGLKAGISIAIGYMPVALTFGLLARTTGLTLYEAVLMSVLVFAGAAQYITLSLLAIGTGAFEIIFTIFIVNIRHLLMSASINEKVIHDSPWKKAIYAFGITDETFTVSATKQGELTTGYMYGLCLISYSSWVAFTGGGYIVGASLPSVIQQGMSVALYAMFIGLLIPSAKKSRKVLFLAGVAALLNSLFTWAHFSTGWAIVLATLLSSILVEWITGRKSNE